MNDCLLLVFHIAWLTIIYSAASSTLAPTGGVPIYTIEFDAPNVSISCSGLLGATNTLTIKIAMPDRRPHRTR